MRLVLFAVLLILVQVVSAGTGNQGKQTGKGSVGGGQHGKPVIVQPKGK